MRRQLIVGGFFIILLAARAGAEETVARPDRSRRSHIQSVSEVAAEETAPWAGLTTSRAPAVLRQQLALERGAGLIVEEVAAGSRAEKAGLQRHDVLVSMDGQLLVLPEQLTTLLQESADDVPLACRLIRGGKETVVSLRPQRAGDSPASAAQSATRRVPLKPAASTLARLPQKAVPPSASGTTVQKGASSGMAVQLPDGSLLQRDHDYTIKLSVGSDTRLVVKDARGWVVFNGAIDTPEQRSLVPMAVRSRVEGLEKYAVYTEPTAKPAVAEQSAAPQPAARIGTLDIPPVTIR